MSTVLKFRRGDTTASNAFTGAEGELFVDTTKDTLVVHDGVTAGGKPLATESYVLASIPSLTGYATESYVTTQINNLIDAAPSALNTLNELAAALGDDANYAASVTTSLAGKQATLVSATNIKTINGNSILGAGDLVLAIPTKTSDITNDSGFITSSSLTWSNITSKPTFATVATSGSYNDLTDKPTSFNGLTLSGHISLTGFVSDYLGQYQGPGMGDSILTSDGGNAVRWQNLKTINGQSIVGSGDITISGGSSSSLTNGIHTVSLESNGTLTVPFNISSPGAGFSISAPLLSSSNEWSFGANGVLHLPPNGDIWDYNGNSVLGGGGISLTDLSASNAASGGSQPSGSLLYNSSNGQFSFYPVDLSTKQNTLVSGTSIKTINGQSLLGGGNITISGGSGGSSLTYGQFADNEVDLTTTAADQVIDSYPAASYRSSKYIIQAVCDQVGIHSTEVMIMHDGTNVYLTEYATLFTDTSLFTVDANITAGDVNLTVTPTNANTSFDVVRTSLAARTFTAPSLQGDLMLLSGSEDLQTATGSVDLNA